MTDNRMRPAKLPLLGSNQDSPDPESDASSRLAGAATSNRSGFAQNHAEPHTICHTNHHPVKPFANVRRDVWLRSLPSRAPKDSPAYLAWKAARDEAQRTAAKPDFPERECACGCGATFRPRSWNQRTLKACTAAARAAEKRRQREADKAAWAEVELLRAVVRDLTRGAAA